ncbi:hypothetical protein BT62DRAFT_914102, partial [Guyanagaster necrorhizus]
PQWVIATRLLYHLQYPVPIQVICKRFTITYIMITIYRQVTQVFLQRQPSPSYLLYEQSSI